MIPRAAIQPDGSIHVTTANIQPTSSFNGAMAVLAGPDALHEYQVAPIGDFANGFMITDSGQLCIAYGGTIAQYAMGLPFTDDGRLVCQLNQPVSEGDAFVGGIRVGPLGGVYVTDVTPPVPHEFGDGFDGGFD